MSVGVVVLAAVVEGDRGAVRGELERGRAADPAGGSGDERDAPVKEPRIGRVEVEAVEVHAR